MTLRRWHFFLAAWLLLLAALLWLPHCWLEGRAQELPCRDPVAGCRLPALEGSVRFDHTPQPMQKFRVDLLAPGAHVVSASFTMRDMSMGFNRYRFLPAGSGHWVAEVMLPACVQGRRDWQMLLEIDRRRYEVAFQSG